MKQLLRATLILGWAGSAWGAAAGADAKKRTDEFIATLLKVKPDEGNLSPADKAANDKAFLALDEFFDYDALTAAPIELKKAKFTPAQRAEYQKKFRELIRLVAYPDSGAFFRKSKYAVTESEPQGETRVGKIDAHVVKDDLKTVVEIFWKATDKGLRLKDVAFDGDSLVRDYENQFARILDKEGAKGLLERIDKKRAELEKPKVKK